MQKRRNVVLSSLALAAAPRAPALAQARGGPGPTLVRIGVLTDLTTGFSAWSGRGSVVAAQMAAADFMAAHPGVRVEVLGGDHQNKPDVASALARRWMASEGVDAVLDVPNSAAALAVNTAAREANKALVVSGSVVDDLTGRACSPNTVHWTIDSWALAHGTGRAVVQAGGSSWYFVTSDFAGGRNLEAAVTGVVKASGGRVLGSGYPPLGTNDYSSFLLQAQASGAKVIGLSMSGSDLANAVKQAAEFGIAARGQKLAGLVVFLTDVEALGLRATQGLQFTEAFYWDLNDETRAWARAFAARAGGRFPTQVQAGVYAGAMHYLKAVVEVGASGDGRQVVAAMKALPTSDPLFGRGAIRPDGRKIHDLHLFEAKRPEESRGPWDLYKLVRTIPGTEAFRPMAGAGCSIVPA